MLLDSIFLSKRKVEWMQMLFKELKEHHIRMKLQLQRDNQERPVTCADQISCDTSHGNNLAESMTKLADAGP